MIRALCFSFLTATAAAQSARPWPVEAVAENFEVRLVAQDRATGTAEYASPHFSIASEINLPVGVVRDLAAVFEATRTAVQALPLGLEFRREPAQYAVRLCASTASYGAAGGPVGSGGFFNGREMLVLLPNLGIQAQSTGLRADYTKNLFVLKHEATHQMLAPARQPMPTWLNEGLAECIAATPYVRGRYTFTNFDSAMRDYLLKWRRTPDRRSLQLLPPARLLSLRAPDWQQQVAAQGAYDLYNSAALFTHWLLHHDGRGDAANLAVFLQALRERQSPADAAAQTFLKDRSPEALLQEVQTLARRMVLDVRWNPSAQ